MTSLPEWLTEPNSKEWVSQAGLTCKINRASFGHLCGYVILPKSHPFYGLKSLSDELKVHGGITYTGIQHIPVKDDSVWLFGFDCAHAFDYIPGKKIQEATPSNYRNMEYVTQQCEALALQIVKQALRLNIENYIKRWSFP